MDTMGYGSKSPKPASESAGQIGIYVISLRERSDRRARIKTELKNFGIDNGINFVIRPRDPRGGITGGFASHLHVWRESGEPYLLVFEDDAILNKDLPTPIGFSDLRAPLVEAADSYLLVFLGAASQAPCRRSPVRGPHRDLGFYEGRFTLMHAYFARRDHLIDQLLPRIWPKYRGGSYLDWAILIKVAPSEQVAIVPPVFLQNDLMNDSDIPWSDFPFFRKTIRKIGVRSTLRRIGKKDAGALRSRFIFWYAVVYSEVMGCLRGVLRKLGRRPDQSG